MDSTDTWQLAEIFQSVYKAPAYHLLLEVVLVFWVFWLIFFRKSYNPKTEQLSEKEKNELIKEWIPEPLVPQIEEKHFALKSKVISSKIGTYIHLDGKKCLNLASHNYLSFSGENEIEKRAIEALRKYGCGSCGPRAFFGTVDIHLEVEKKLAKFLDVEETVLYSYGFSTVASAIPAYAKKGDIIFCDEAVNFSIQKGLIASRSDIKFFKHNDFFDLKRLLEENKDREEKNPKKAKVTRKFLVVEGLYINTGKICPIKEMIKLKNEYKVRLFVDESYSLGVLGETGKGIKEHFKINSLEIDNITASLENSFASYGGFSAGTSFVVDHQRLSGTGYCFSASLPPLQAAVSIVVVEELEKSAFKVTKLRENSIYFHQKLLECSELDVEGNEISPIKHLRFKYKKNSILEDENDLDKVVEYCYDKGYALTRSRYLEKEEFKLPQASIRLTVNSDLNKELINNATKIISEAFKLYTNEQSCLK